MWVTVARTLRPAAIIRLDYYSCVTFAGFRQPNVANLCRIYELFSAQAGRRCEDAGLLFCLGFQRFQLTFQRAYFARQIVQFFQLGHGFHMLR